MTVRRRIYVTPRSVTRTGHPALSLLTDAGFEIVSSTPGVQPDEATLLRDLPGCCGYLAGVERISARVLEAATSLKVISRNGVGTDAIDLSTADRLGIAVRNTPGANAQGVAELTMGLLFSLARWIPLVDRRLKQQEWAAQRGAELVGRTLGLVGCGRIGRTVAQMAISLGMKVRAYDTRPDPSFEPAGDWLWTSMDHVLRQADFVSLHCPPPDDGQPIITTAALAMMKPGVRIINTARAELIDEGAMLTALQSGHVAGLAIDSYCKEPPGAHPLVMHERVVATAHIGALTDESVDRATFGAVDNLLDHFGLARSDRRLCIPHV